MSYSEDKLRIKLQTELFSSTGKVIPGLKDILIRILSDMNKQEPLFETKYAPLNNLAYNSLVLQILNSVNENSPYDENCIIAIVNKSIKNTKIIMNTIIDPNNHLSDYKKKHAYYDIMNNNHLVAAQVYKKRQNFFCHTINKLCALHNIYVLPDVILSSDALANLFEIVHSIDIPRIQRALEVILKHGDSLITINENGEEKSNIIELGLNNGDIYSLHLLTRVDTNDIHWLINIAYDSIFVESSSKHNNKYFSSLYYLLYFPIWQMCIKTETDHILSYIHKEVNNFQRSLDIFKGMKSLVIYDARVQFNINSIWKSPNFTFDTFKNNLVLKHTSSIIDKISVIANRPISTKVIITSEENNYQKTRNGNRYLNIKGKFARAFLVIMVIFALLLIFCGMFVLYPNEVNLFISNIFYFLFKKCKFSLH
ncbi:hypothetical protein NEQG_00344 [Nematocida parisii ERTm3]|uniref:Uncharacterized protein n=1 Tax=Nematocida parisii (strain ERTm3) TaxID=935791 RepID=I3EK27_NEMP3|nr:hypothetical protein NEQG_00344 [Nematocida parisii ERTm3]